MQIETVITGDLQVNCYVVINNGEAVVIDPGDDAQKIIDAAGANKIKAVLLTHGHFDHTGAAGILQKNGAEVYVSKNDAAMLADSYLNLSSPFGFPFKPVKNDRVYEDELNIIGLSFKVIETPGHTVGSICLYSDGILFSGDTLFYGSIGRTDFPGGSFEVIAQSIRQKLQTLPDDTCVYAGHGEPTTIYNEKMTNPFVR